MTQFGHGSLTIETLNPVPSLGQTLMMELCYAGVAVQSNPTEVQSRCRDRKTGILKTKRKGLNEIIHTVTLTFEHMDWKHLGFFHDELPQDAATATNQTKFVTVPTASPYEITDTDITATTAPNVRAYVTTKGSWGDAIYLKNVSVATADKTQVQVDETTSKLVFHEELAGAEVAYIVDQDYNAIQSIGYNDTWESFGNIEMWFKAFGTEDFDENLAYHFPEMIRTVAPPVINWDQSPITVSVTYEANSVTGRTYPYQIYNPEYAIAV